MNAKDFGRESEDFVADFVRKQGWKVLERNYHTRFGEIDLIAEERGEIVFIEVKARKNTLYGSALESVTEAKMEKIITSAQLYLLSKKWDEKPYRIDVFCVTKQGENCEIEHLRNVG